MKSRVRLVNLKTVAMNGKCGSRREWNEDKGRFVVHLDDGRIVNVKPENLETVKKNKTKDEQESTHMHGMQSMKNGCGTCMTLKK